MANMPLHVERHRIMFLLNRDGFEQTLAFVAQTHRAYRLSLKYGMAKEKQYRQGYLESCIDFRRFLRAHEAYVPVLTKIKHS